MADSVYVAMNAASARAKDLELIADNLANVDTPGFQGSQAVFESFLPPHEDGERTDQVHVAVVGAGVDRRSGPAVVTGNALDVRLGDGAYFAVATKDGSTGYTRDGRLSVDKDGVVYAGDNAVLGDDLQRIRVPAGSNVSISETGEVKADGVVAGVLGRFHLDGELSRLQPAVVSGDAMPVEARVETGMREGSNVNALSTVVRLVAAQRAYDQAMQAVTTARGLDQKAAELGRVR